MRSSSSMRRSRLGQHRPARLVADRDAFHAHDRRRERAAPDRESGRARTLSWLISAIGCSLAMRLQPRLRLPRLRRLVAETVDERLHVLALGVLLGAQLARCSDLLLAVLPLEGIVAAAPEGELAVDQVDDRIDRRVEQVAVVADDDHRARIAREIALQPQRAFEVEVVRRLVEEQEVRLGEEQRRRAPRACASRPKSRSRAAPAPRRRSRGRRGCGRRAPPLRARRYRRAARGSRRCGAGRWRARLRGAARRARGRRRAPSRAAICGPLGASCSTRPMRVPFGSEIDPASGAISPAMARKSVVLPAPLRPTKPAFEPAGQRQARALEQRASGDPEREVGDLQHGARSRRGTPADASRVVGFLPGWRRAAASKKLYLAGPRDNAGGAVGACRSGLRRG